MLEFTLPHSSRFIWRRTAQAFEFSDSRLLHAPATETQFRHEMAPAFTNRLFRSAMTLSHGERQRWE